MNRHTRKANGGVSRRNMLKAVGIGGAAALGAASTQGVAQAQVPGNSVETMLNVAITAEALATTLVYGVNHPEHVFSTAAGDPPGCAARNADHRADPLRSARRRGRTATHHSVLHP